MVNYTWFVVLLLFANISSAIVTIKKKDYFAVDQPVKQNTFLRKPAVRKSNKQTRVQKACDCSDPALTTEQ